jgi:hypothetical protein
MRCVWHLVKIVYSCPIWYNQCWIFAFCCPKFCQVFYRYRNKGFLTSVSHCPTQSTFDYEAFRVRKINSVSFLTQKSTTCNFFDFYLACFWRRKVKDELKTELMSSPKRCKCSLDHTASQPRRYIYILRHEDLIYIYILKLCLSYKN